MIKTNNPKKFICPVSGAHFDQQPNANRPRLSIIGGDMQASEGTLVCVDGKE